jgi:hypothetical protein
MLHDSFDVWEFAHCICLAATRKQCAWGSDWVESLNIRASVVSCDNAQGPLQHFNDINIPQDRTANIIQLRASSQSPSSRHHQQPLQQHTDRQVTSTISIMEGLEVSLVMAQAALTAKNSSIGEAAAVAPPALIDGDNST